LIITNILDWLLTIGSLVDYCSHHSGFSIFSGGTDEKNVGNGPKRLMRASIIGLIVALSGVVVFMH